MVAQGHTGNLGHTGDPDHTGDPALRPYSDGTESFVRVTTVGGRRRLSISFRVPRGSGVASAHVRSTPDGEPEYRALRRIDDGLWERWEGLLPVPGPRLGYRFILQHGGRLWHLDQRGLHAEPPCDDADFVHLATSPPAWLAGRTLYEIVPDRFERGRDSGPGDDLLPWGAPPPGYRQRGERAFYGGDLAGIRERLDYLRDLGVGGLYLTPIFLAGTNHRYDVRDHQRIDPRLGDAQLFAALCRSLHETDLRIVLDGVFNHVGDGHRWFNRGHVHPEPGAWQDPASPYAEYFIFRRHPDRFESWCGHASLPKLDYRSARLRDEIYGGRDSVVRRWLRPPYGIDGWRLDAVNMLGRCGAVQVQREVLRELRQAAKETSAAVYVVGETFADPTALVQGDQLDGVMAYHGFYYPLLRWLTGREPQGPRGLVQMFPANDDASVFARAATDLLARAPFAIGQAHMTLLGSHDTARILTLLDGDRAKLRLAFTLLLTWPGVPCVYYGDELGCEGGVDPANRACMPWDEDAWDRELRDHVRAMIALRRVTPELARGGVQVRHARDGALVFVRILAAGAVLVALNRADHEERLVLPVDDLGAGTFDDLLGGGEATLRDGMLSLALAPWSARVLRIAT